MMSRYLGREEDWKSALVFNLMSEINPIQQLCKKSTSWLLFTAYCFRTHQAATQQEVVGSKAWFSVRTRYYVVGRKRGRILCLFFFLFESLAKHAKVISYRSFLVPSSLSSEKKSACCFFLVKKKPWANQHLLAKGTAGRLEAWISLACSNLHYSRFAFHCCFLFLDDCVDWRSVLLIFLPIDILLFCSTKFHPHSIITSITSNNLQGKVYLFNVWLRSCIQLSY